MNLIVNEEGKAVITPVININGSEDVYMMSTDAPHDDGEGNTVQTVEFKEIGWQGISLEVIDEAYGGHVTCQATADSESPWGVYINYQGLQFTVEYGAAGEGDITPFVSEYE